MPKLTETTNDRIKASAQGNGSFMAELQHITAPHEPLPGEPFTPLPMPMIPAVVQPKRKGGRPKKVVSAPPQTAQITPQLKPLRIALVGTAPSSRLLAPVHDPSWLIWGCSPGNQGVFHRLDAWFEVHGTILLEPSEKAYAGQYIHWMQNLQCPVYMQDQQIVPRAISIPKNDLIAEFGPYFFTSSFAWMMAMAIKVIEKQFPAIESRKDCEIRLFGIDMASRDEYVQQRPGAYHFFQEAARRGIKITAPNESDIMQPPPLYGFSDVEPYGRKIRSRSLELTERIGPMENQLKELNNNLMYLKGAKEDCDYFQCIQGGVQDNSGIHYQYLDSLIEKAKATSVSVAASVILKSQG